MSTKIRLARAGSNKRPFYRVVVADSRSPRDGRFIEKIGTYDPLLSKDNENRIALKADRVEYWLSKGAIPSKRVVSFLTKSDLGKDNKHVKAVLKRKEAVIALKKAVNDKKAEVSEAKVSDEAKA